MSTISFSLIYIQTRRNSLFALIMMIASSKRRIALTLIYYSYIISHWLHFDALHDLWQREDRSKNKKIYSMFFKVFSKPFQCPYFNVVMCTCPQIRLHNARRMAM